MQVNQFNLLRCLAMFLYLFYTKFCLVETHEGFLPNRFWSSAGDAGHGQEEGRDRGPGGGHPWHRRPHHQPGRRQDTAQGVRQPRRHPEGVCGCACAAVVS